MGIYTNYVDPYRASDTNKGMKSKTLKEYEGRLCKVKDLYAIVDDIVEIRNQMYKHLNSQKAYDDINQLNEICEQLQAYHYHIDFAPLYEKKVMREDIFHNDNFQEFRK